MNNDKIADMMMELMTREKFVDWYDNTYVPEMIEEITSPERAAAIKAELVKMIEQTRRSMSMFSE